MRLTSSAFEHEGSIPAAYTCDGGDISPPLHIADVPPGAKSLALIMDDPDAVKPAGHVWDHWVVWNIDPTTIVIAENSAPGIEGVNSRGKNSYGGPCPPDGEHRYYFKLYALSETLDLPASTLKTDLEQAMDGHILAKTELMGTYTRSS